MPTIAFVSSKGGTGKTTAALMLALGLKKLGLTVAVIDCDPNLPLFGWARRSGDAIRVFPATSPGELREILPLARARANWVIIDTEGSIRGRSLLLQGEIELAIIPVGPSSLEADEALRTSKALREMPGRAGGFLPHACLITRMPAALKPRSLKATVRRLREAEISILETPLFEKEAFRAVFAFNAPLEGLSASDVSGLQAAITNVHHLTVSLLKLFAPKAPPPKRELPAPRMEESDFVLDPAPRGSS